MDKLLDVPLLLISLALVVAGQAYRRSQSRRRRSEAAVLQRSLYYKRIARDYSNMGDDITRRVQNLEQGNQKIADKLKALGVDINRDCDDEDPMQLEKIISNLKQKKKQLQSIEDEIAEVSQGSDLGGGEESLDVVMQKINQLRIENEQLKSQIDSCNQPSLPFELNEMDQELLDYLRQHTFNCDIECLTELYETLLEIKAASPDQTLDAYLSRLTKNKANYETEFTNLDVRRKRVEKRLKETERLYENELSSFNETRIEYLFKNTGAQELLKQLREKNSISERILDHLRKDKELKKEIGQENSVPVWPMKENQYHHDL